jgi:hypothetical protein
LADPINKIIINHNGIKSKREKKSLLGNPTDCDRETSLDIFSWEYAADEKR